MSHAAIVTGASRGIGRAIAVHLADTGWDVFNLDLLAPGADAPGEWLQVDLANRDATAAAVRSVCESGPIHGLVNNAAIGRMALLEDTDETDLDDSLAINLVAPVLLAKALVPGMRAAGFGRIVNISSRAHLGKTHRSAYAATKGAMVSLARVWALELAQFGITANAVAPGPVRTELFERANPPGMPRTRAIVDAIPVGRLGEPEDIANAVSFFMSERSGFITGQTLYVCGGVTLARGGS